jgi:inosine/xanthosine triphosphate pyrophosphatase family protein
VPKLNKYLAELGMDVKNHLRHRGKGIHAFKTSIALILLEAPEF